MGQNFHRFQKCTPLLTQIEIFFDLNLLLYSTYLSLLLHEGLIPLPASLAQPQALKVPESCFNLLPPKFLKG